MKPRPLLLALATAAATLALSSSPASAALTTSNITSPADGTVIYSQNGGTVTVSGTSNGTTGDHVEAICFYGNQVGVVGDDMGPVAIPVAADGSFSMNVNRADFFGQGLINPCVLRAIPQPVTAPPPANPPGSPSNFTGPTITVQGQSEDRFSSGPNNGTLFDFYLQDVQSKGAFDYVSTGGCGVYDSYLWDPVTFAVADSLFYCNDGLFATDGDTRAPDPGELPATGSELRVDGVNAYLAGAVNNFDPIGNGFEPSTKSGYQGITWSPTYDPVTQGVTITESEPAMKCSPSPGTFPPTNTSCASFVPAGVKLDRTIVQDHDGRLATIKTRWSSTDGAQHQLSVELENDEHRNDSPPRDVALEFPWLSPNFTVPTLGDLAGPPSGPGRINVRGSLAAADGDESTERGAIVFAGPPKSERVYQQQSSNSSYVALTLNYDRTVPPTGSTQFAFAYAHAFTQADVDALANAAQAGFTPTVAMNPPTHSTFAKTVKVSGTSAFADGVAGVSVNGTAATVAPDGSWTASVPLKGGHNSLGATVASVYGGTATTAAADVVYAKLGLVGKPKAKGRFVVFRIHCDGDAGSSCPGNALLAVKEKLRGHRVVGLTAKKRAKLRTKRISAGHKKFKVAGQKTATIKVPLSKRSLKLLKHFHKLPVRLTVNVAATGVKDRVGGSKVVFRLKKKPRKP